MNGAKIPLMVTLFSVVKAEGILEEKKMDTKKIILARKIYMRILLWIQGWSGQLNSWAWTRWSELHRKDQETMHGLKDIKNGMISLKGEILSFYFGSTLLRWLKIIKITKIL